MSEANESTCGVTESRTVLCGRGGSGRSIPAVGNGRSRELCEALVLARCMLQANHFRFLSNNHSRPSAAKIKTTMMLHGVDEADGPLGCSIAFSLTSDGERGPVGAAVAFGSGGKGVVAVPP